MNATLEKLNIAMMGHKRIPSNEGGVEVVVEALCARMVNEGHAVTCYNRAGHHVSGAEHEIPAGNIYRGIRLVTVPTVERKGFSAVVSSFLAALGCAFGPYDVVHIHAEGPAFFCWLPKLCGKRVIVTVHGLDWQREKWNGSFASKFIRLGERSAVRFADEIIVLSDNVLEYFLDNYGRVTRYIPNGVSVPRPESPHLISEKWGLKKDGYILYLGRIVPEKGGTYLIEAFKRVKTDKKLVIAGGSSDTEYYLSHLRELASEDDRILFTGFVQGRIRDELYSNAYVYTLPSDLEGMPLSLLEAMSYGNCCLVSDISECTEVVEDKALQFNRSSVDDLHDKLQMLCDHPETVASYRTDAARFILSKYRWNDAVGKTLALYRRKRKRNENSDDQ